MRVFSSGVSLAALALPPFLPNSLMYSFISISCNLAATIGSSMLSCCKLELAIPLCTHRYFKGLIYLCAYSGVYSFHQDRLFCACMRQMRTTTYNQSLHYESFPLRHSPPLSTNVRGGFLFIVDKCKHQSD